MRVLTWNLWWRFGPWQSRQGAIAAELKAVAPDVALLQEVWADPPGRAASTADTDGVDHRWADPADPSGDQAQNLAEVTGMHVARTHDADGSPQGFGNAVLSRWPIEQVETVRLPGVDGAESRRTALIVRIEAPTCTLLTAVTHLSWEYHHSALRQQQLALVVARLDHHRGATAADGSNPPRPELTVLAGDLNATPDSDEVRRLTGKSAPYVDGLVFTDAWSAVTDEPGHTWARTNPHRVDSQWPRRRLDYVMVGWPRPKPLGNPLSVALVGVDAHDGVVPSDHYGVVAELDDRIFDNESSYR